MNKARIVIHDFVGHPFQVQLSRELARRGHDILHVHFSGFQTPKGSLEVRPSDPPGFAVKAVSLGYPYPKYSFIRRLAADRDYVGAMRRILREFSPNVLLSGNASPFVQGGLLAHCKRNGIGFVNWVQDCYGRAAADIFRRRFGPPGVMLGRCVVQYERRVVRRSDHAILISSDFESAFPDCRASTVIENWAPIDDIEPKPKSNPWSLARNLSDKRVVLYAGTLGLKHNPELLVRLALHFRDSPDVVIAVVSEGLGREFLELRRLELGLTNLALFDFQPFRDLADVVGTADVLVSIIEKDAGEFSVPSKVLTYLCAGRPLVLAVPAANLAARTVTKAKAGLVVDPTDVDGLVAAVETLLRDGNLAGRMADHGRAYAMLNFNIERIADRFEIALDDVVRLQHSSSTPGAIDAETASLRSDRLV